MKTRQSYQRGALHFSLALFISGLMAIGSFITSTYNTLTNKQDTATPTTQQTTSTFAQPASTVGTIAQVSSPAVSGSTPVITIATPQTAPISITTQSATTASPAIAPLVVPSTVVAITTYNNVTSNTADYQNNYGFFNVTITATTATVTVTNTDTQEQVPTTLKLNVPAVVLGHTLTLTKITKIASNPDQYSATIVLKM